MSSPSGFSPEEMIDVQVKINQVMKVSQPHETCVEDLLRELLIGKMIADPESTFGEEFVTIINVSILPSKKDTNGIRMIATVLDDDGEPHTVWLNHSSFYIKMHNPKWKIQRIDNENMESFLAAMGIELGDEDLDTITPSDLGMEEAAFNDYSWEKYLDKYEDFEKEIEAADEDAASQEWDQWWEELDND